MKRFEITFGKTKGVDPQPLPKRVVKACPNCSGTGKIGSKDCIACAGMGKRSQEV